MSKDETLVQLSQAVIDCDPDEARRLAQLALDRAIDPLVCINQALTPGIQRVGALFSSGEYFLPDLIIAGEAMKEALEILEPALMSDQKREVAGRVVLGTVEGDLHEIGKTLVGTMLTANGFDVTDIGIDKSAADFVTAVKESDANLVGASALLTTTMLQQLKIVEALQEAGLRDRVKVIVGGAPVTQEWADKVAADGYAEDAISAVALAKRLMAVPA
jgi:corrinoid protein of di/trimethylamine methyltransferase